MTCNNTSIPPQPKWQGYRVLNISIDDAEMRVLTYVARECYTSNGTNYGSFTSSATAWRSFPFSHARNRFVALGCDTIARLTETDNLVHQNVYTRMGCMSFCLTNNSVEDGVCSGAGCCESSIPKGLFGFNISIGSENNYTSVTGFNPCSFSFLAADDFYNFSIADLRNNSFRGTDDVPTILDWSVMNTCNESKKNSTAYACGDNSFCKDSDKGMRVDTYVCQCSPGYQGNPYLGCQDVDECQDSSTHNCDKMSKCVNTDGGYNCSCPKGYQGDGQRDGNGCTDIDECLDSKLNDCKGECINKLGSYSCSNSLAINVAVGIGVGNHPAFLVVVVVVVVVVIIGSTFLFWGLRKRKLIQLKEKFFEQNGGFLLQQLVEQKELTSNMLKIFTAEELKTATKNYDDSLIAGRGGFATVYKGTLLDGSLVAIKKSKQTDVDVDEAQVKQFISEVVVLCQVNNRNIVRILGCCLETPSPLLVYEFVSNGTLFEHLHDKEEKYLSKGTLSWETRLKIATQTAGVLSYLHSQAVTPIIHRDIKSTNILLDENLNPKVSDFGASKLIAYDEMEVCTMVQGTLGYLDPEYLQTSQLTEKSDVYSFGVVLVELLTGQKAIRFNKSEEERSLAKYFLSALQENRLVEVLERRVVEEGSVELLQEVANIARCCLSLNGEERPNMKQVAVVLEGLRNMGVDMHFSSWNGTELHSEEDNVYLLGEGVENYDSIKNQVVITIPTDGR
ncbi:hypothetical protein RD792_000867 [Penstemon davidsonii]|uniref:Uncharacterized protein n=1 Tax=Penstemon davidsonii TaxID=160366 RepID=A0ABR0DLV5_9LAMI|nr:hypothetical protein RD792_000867 [Penstemon davidsonii]